MGQSDDLDILKSEIGEIRDKLDRITSEGRKTGLVFTALGVGLALLLAGIVLLAAGTDYRMLGDGTMIVLSSDSELFGKIFTIIGLVVIVASSALAALWPRVRKQD